jgi:uncharacterized protein YndB with AHSA1/START domain
MLRPRKMTVPSVTHSTFVIERSFAAPVERVFAAWSNPVKKQRWFACHDDWKTVDYQLDFRQGGVEINDATERDGTLHAFRGYYLDLVLDARIVYAYEMSVGGTRISASLVTVVFAALGAKTKMTFTEQIAFLDGHGDAHVAERREGTELGLARIDAEL